MSDLLAIVLGGIAMSAVASIGLVATVLPRRAFDAVIIPLVALAAGSLMGGALFHMLPKSVERLGNTPATYGLVAAGAFAFLVLEQALHWHHCHRAPDDHIEPCSSEHGGRKPVGYLVLTADALHNFLGGLAVGAAFILDIRVGVVAWLVAAAHEIPQELGDFGLLVHSGWSRLHALLFNVLSASTFLIGGILAWAFSGAVNTAWLVPFAAGNFLYIAMADLIPQVTAQREIHGKVVPTTALVLGLALMYLAAGLAN